MVLVAKRMETIDITDKPDLVDVAEEVRTTGEPLVLRRGGEDLAVIRPVTKAAIRPPKSPAMRRLKPKRLSEADREAFLSAAGGWADVDTDKLIEDIYAARAVQRPSSEP